MNAALAIIAVFIVSTGALVASIVAAFRNLHQGTVNPEPRNSQ